MLLFSSKRSKSAWCCWVVEVLFIPREMFFGCRVEGMLPRLILVCYKRPNVGIVVLPAVVSVVEVGERDYLENDAQ